MNPERLLFLLVAAALSVAIWLNGRYWKTHPSRANGEAATALRAENAQLVTQIDTLKDELANARAQLAKSPYPIPVDFIAYIEKDLGLKFVEAPEARLSAPDQMQEAASRNLDLLYEPESLARIQECWELFGVLPANHSLRGQWIAIESESSLGLIDYRDGRILLADHFDLESVPHQSILIRQLARLLMLQHSPLPGSWRSDDERHAWLAARIGAAANCQSRFIRRKSLSEESSWKDPEAGREELLLTLSPRDSDFS